MRIVLILICSFALASLTPGAQQEKKKEQPKKKQAQSTQHAAAPGGGPQKAKGSQKVAAPGGHQTTVTQPPSVTQKTAGGRSAERAGAQKTKKQTKGSQQIATQGGLKGGGAPAGPQKAKKSKESVTNAAVQAKGKPGQAATATTGKTAAKGKAAAGEPLKPQHFNLAKQPNTAKAPPVKFQQGKHIQGSRNWQGQRYTVFRNYTPVWHDQTWWHGHHNRIVFVFGAPYFWNAGYWFPAWGYYPNAYYAWDGPIYAYNDLPPDQVIANVQTALQQQGYYQGEVDGLIGPLTREAIAGYQRGHGLYETSSIDQPTLESLGMA
jgi:hypothetical protein